MFDVMLLLMFHVMLLLMFAEMLLLMFLDCYSWCFLTATPDVSCNATRDVWCNRACYASSTATTDVWCNATTYASFNGASCGSSKATSYASFSATCYNARCAADCNKVSISNQGIQETLAPAGTTPTQNTTTAGESHILNSTTCKTQNTDPLKRGQTTKRHTTKSGMLTSPVSVLPIVIRIVKEIFPQNWYF